MIDTAQLEAEIAALEERLAPFQSTAWAEIVGELASEHRTQMTMLVHTAAGEQLLQVRGRVQALEWAIGLPERLKAEITVLGAQLEDATEDEEGDE